MNFHKIVDDEKTVPKAMQMVIHRSELIVALCSGQMRVFSRAGVLLREIGSMAPPMGHPSLSPIGDRMHDPWQIFHGRSLCSVGDRLYCFFRSPSCAEGRVVLQVMSVEEGSEEVVQSCPAPTSMSWFGMCHFNGRLYLSGRGDWEDSGMGQVIALQGL